MAQAERKVFGKLQNTYDPPDLIEIQTTSYNEFLQADVQPAKREEKGLQAVFHEIFPVASFAEFVSDDGAIAQTLKIRGIYWDEKSEKLIRAETSGALDLNSADSVQQAKNLGVELAREIQKQL